MRLQLFALPVLAAIAEAAAISSKPSSVCTTCPVTIQNTDSAIASILSQMSAQSPKAILTTTSITGSPVAATAVAKMSTTAPTTAKPNAATTSKASVGTSTSSKKRQRRAVSTTSSSSVAASATNGAACSPMPNFGYTYTPSNAAPSAFLKDSTLRAQYMSAAVPQNYVWRFAGFYASVSQSGYMFYTELSTYSPTQCASICDANAACKGFNIYFERAPKLTPGDGCSNPSPQVDIKCAFYSTAVSEANAVNVGSWRSSFNVVITGANGYTKM